ncbi:MAG: S-layer homology domain-containing protein [Eubacteriales bacterium]
MMKKLLMTLLCAWILMGTVFATEIVAPSGLLLEDGTLLVADTYNHAIWQVEDDGSYTKLAGREATLGADNRPMGGYNDGSALNAAFNTPWSIAPFGDGYAIADSANNVIRYLADGEVTTLAGSGVAGSKNATGTKATFSRPTGLVSDGAGGLYVADSDNNAIRHISSSGVVTTYTGGTEGMADGTLTSAKFSDPTGLAFADGALYVADTGNHRICKIESGKVTTIAGGTDGYDDGNIATATFSSPTGLLVEDETIYVADSANGAVRAISGSLVTTLVVAGNESLTPINPRGLAMDGDTLWIGDVFSKTLNSISGEVKLFEDVGSGDWYTQSIYTMVAKGYMNGTGATTFEPENTMTRAMFVQVLFNMEGATAPTDDLAFTDVGDVWYKDAVAWASGQEIVTGTSDTTFAPEGKIERQQMVVMLYRYAQGESDGASLAHFTDLAQLEDYAVEAMEWAYGTGIINGTSATTLNPTGQATRAEAATMLNNFTNQVH